MYIPEIIAPQSPFYCTIVHPSAGTVTGHLLEDITYALQSNFDSPLNDSGGMWHNLMVYLSGQSPKHKNLSVSLWQSTDFFRMSIPMEFVARDDVMKDVIDPVRQLTKMAAPIGTGFLKQPEVAIVTIGQVLTIPECYVIGVSPVMSRQMVEGNKPQKATVSVEIQSCKITSQEDIEAMFMG